MGAGSLRHLVTLEQRTQAADSGVGISVAFMPVAQVWAKVEGVKGALYQEVVQVAEGPTHRIVIRARRLADFDHIAELLQAPPAVEVTGPYQPLAEDFDYAAATFLAEADDLIAEDFDYVASLFQADAEPTGSEEFDYLAGTFAMLPERRWRVKNLRDPDGTGRWVEIMAEELKREPES